MVDEVRVLRLLRSVSDDLAVLRAEAGADETRRADPLWLRGIKYSFVTAIEGCVDVALGQRLARAVGFRNVLVHEYARVDDAIVLARLDDPSDLDAFVSAVGDWMSAER